MSREREGEAEAMKSGVFVLAVLDAVAANQPIGVSELARLVGRPKTSVQRALVTLHRSGWIRPAAPDDNRWQISLKAIRVANSVSTVNRLSDAAQPVMRRLMEETGESVIVCEREGDDWVVVDDVEGNQAVRVVYSVGLRAPLHAGASGVAILAALPAAECEDYLRRPLSAITQSTTTDPARLREVIEEIRRQGWAASSNETAGGLAGVAAVIEVEGRPIGSLAVSIPAQRHTPERVAELGPVVHAAAREISAALG